MWDVVATTTPTADETNDDAMIALLLLFLAIVFDMNISICIFTLPTFYLEQ